MIITLSIAVGALAAYLGYRMLFYDASDFWEGCGKFVCCFSKMKRGLWSRQGPWPPPPEYFEDEGWSSGIRFALFLTLSLGSGFLVYHELHKHFG